MTSKRHSNRPNNTAAIGKRSFNANIRHYRELHDPNRQRSAAELDKMLEAARKNPNGKAAQLLVQIGKMPRGVKAFQE